MITEPLLLAAPSGEMVDRRGQISHPLGCDNRWDFSTLLGFQRQQVADHVSPSAQTEVLFTERQSPPT